MGASLIHRSFIERDVLHELRRLAERGTPPAAILVTGRRGSGKSAIIGELIQTLARDPSWRILAMDAAALSHEANTLAVGNRFGLPVPPGSALAAASIGARGLFVLDALDAVSLSRDKPPELFPVLNAVINEVRAYPNVTLLVSCRSEDLASDERLRVLAYGSEPAEVVEVTELPTAQLVDLIEQLGVDIKSLSENQLRLLSTPELLKCFIESVEAGPPDFDTAEELRGRYVDFKTRGS
jgi:hypothetical protein